MNSTDLYNIINPERVDIMPNYYNRVRHIMFVTKDVYKKLNTIGNKSKYNFSKTIEVLISTVFKYNYDENLNYIPCIQISLPTDYVPVPENHKKIDFYLPQRLETKIDALAKKNCSKIVDVIRNLIAVALEQCFDENLMFIKPVPMTLPKSGNNGKKVVMILS